MDGDAPMLLLGEPELANDNVAPFEGDTDAVTLGVCAADDAAADGLGVSDGAALTAPLEDGGEEDDANLLRVTGAVVGMGDVVAVIVRVGTTDSVAVKVAPELREGLADTQSDAVCDALTHAEEHALPDGDAHAVMLADCVTVTVTVALSDGLCADDALDAREGDAVPHTDADGDPETDRDAGPLGTAVDDKHSVAVGESDASDGDGDGVPAAGPHGGAAMLNVARCVPAIDDSGVDDAADGDPVAEVRAVGRVCVAEPVMEGSRDADGAGDSVAGGDVDANTV